MKIEQAMFWTKSPPPDVPRTRRLNDWRHFFIVGSPVFGTIAERIRVKLPFWLNVKGWRGSSGGAFCVVPVAVHKGVRGICSDKSLSAAATFLRMLGLLLSPPLAGLSGREISASFSGRNGLAKDQQKTPSFSISCSIPFRRGLALFQ